MTSGLTTFLIAAGAVTIAEMGDKTQLLAMCFAARYKARQVLLGVFMATVLNHAFAVAAGYLLKSLLAPFTVYIQIAASLSFIGFALWTVKGDAVEEDACDSRPGFGPVAAVAIAFFLAEMGDKTQLATVSLAANYGNPVAVLIGTTTGMLVADGVGIVFGVVMNKKIPEKVLKWISASIFTAFGLAGFVGAALQVMPPAVTIAAVLLIIAITVNLTLFIIKRNGRDKKRAELKEV